METFNFFLPFFFFGKKLFLFFSLCTRMFRLSTLTVPCFALLPWRLVILIKKTTKKPLSFSWNSIILWIWVLQHITEITVEERSHQLLFACISGRAWDWTKKSTMLFTSHYTPGRVIVKVMLKRLQKTLFLYSSGLFILMIRLKTNTSGRLSLIVRVKCTFWECQYVLKQF